MKAATVVAARNFTGGASQCPDPMLPRLCIGICWAKNSARLILRALFCAHLILRAWVEKEAGLESTLGPLLERPQIG
jgi:hypothetical protein